MADSDENTLGAQEDSFAGHALAWNSSSLSPTPLLVLHRIQQLPPGLGVRQPGFTGWLPQMLRPAEANYNLLAGGRMP